MVRVGQGFGLVYAPGNARVPSRLTSPYLVTSPHHPPTLQVPRQKTDGEFWISLADFKRLFRAISVCRLFKTVDEGGRWYNQSVEGRSGTGGYKKLDGPQYLLTIERPAELYISMGTTERKNPPPIQVFLTRPQDPESPSSRSTALLVSNVVGEIKPFCPYQMVHMTCRPEPGTYVILPLCMNAGPQFDLSLSVFADYEFALREL